MSDDNDDKFRVSPDAEIKGDKPSQKSTKEEEGRAIIRDEKASNEEARAIIRDEYEQALFAEDIKLRKQKRVVGIAVSIAAILIHTGILYSVYRILFCECRSDLVTIFSISTAVLSFVVIYGIIIRSTLASPQQDKGDSNLSTKDALEIAYKISSNNQ